MRKLLTDKELLSVFADLWEERVECYRRAGVMSAALAPVLFVLWYMWTVTGGVGTVRWLVFWGILQAGILVQAVLAARNVDRRAGAALDRSAAFNRLVN